MKKKIQVTDVLEIFNLLRKLQNSKKKFWIFPDFSELTETSPIHLAKLGKIEYDRLVIRPSTVNKFSLKKVSTLIFFCRDEELAFKAPIRNYHDEIITVLFPEEVFSFGEEDLEKVPRFKKIVRDYREKRSEKRKNPKDKKTVGIGKASVHSFQKKITRKFDLLDLSPSGMGILAKAVDDFQLGDEVEIRTVEGKDLDGTILGEVRSVRELKNGGYKIGILFNSREKK